MRISDWSSDVCSSDLSAATANMADPRNAKIAPQPRQNSVRYFTDWALAQLDEYVGDTSQPLNVTTTLDLGMQKAADEAIDRFTPRGAQGALVAMRSEEHTSELQSLMRISYAVFCLKK